MADVRGQMAEVLESRIRNDVKRSDEGEKLRRLEGEKIKAWIKVY